MGFADIAAVEVVVIYKTVLVQAVVGGRTGQCGTATECTAAAVVVIARDGLVESGQPFGRRDRHQCARDRLSSDHVHLHSGGTGLLQPGRVAAAAAAAGGVSGAGQVSGAIVVGCILHQYTAASHRTVIIVVEGVVVDGVVGPRRKCRLHTGRYRRAGVRTRNTVARE